MRPRTLSVGAVAAAALLTLSGCVRVDVETTVHTDDTYSQDIVLAADAQALAQVAAQSDMEVPDLGDLTSQDAVAALGDDYPDHVTVADYRDGDLEGVAITVADLPLSEFEAATGAATAGLGTQATLERVDDTFVVTLQRDDSMAQPLAGAGVDAGVLEGAIDFEIVYRFPGQVIEANAGEIDGNNVTLGLTDLLDTQDIRIVAGADPSINWGPLVQWGLIALGFAVIIGGATLLVIQDRRRRHSTHLPPPIASDDH